MSILTKDPELMSLLHTYAQKESNRVYDSVEDDKIEEFAAKPADVFDAYRLDPIVHGILSYWMRGDITWEQALMKCVVVLSEQVQILMKEKTDNWARQPVPPFSVTLHNREEDSE